MSTGTCLTFVFLLLGPLDTSAGPTGSQDRCPVDQGPVANLRNQREAIDEGVQLLGAEMHGHLLGKVVPSLMTKMSTKL